MKDNKPKSFVSNVIIILIAQIVVKILGMLYRTVITNIDGFGDSGNGYYSAGFQIYTLLLAISSVGIPNAISKLVSEKTALNDLNGAKKIFKTALIVFSVIGAALSLSLFFLSEPIAKFLLNMEGAKYTLAALSPSIFFVCVSSVYRGYFSGINKMGIMSASQIIEQAFKSVLTVMFVLLSVGSAAEYMSAYANIATTAATVFGTVYLFYAYKSKRNNSGYAKSIKIKSDFVFVARKILAIAIPISICSVISAINRIIDTATIMRGIESAFSVYIPARIGSSPIINPTLAQLNAEAVRLSGMLSKSDTLINMPLALNIALATVLVPSISKCCAEKNYVMIKKYINSSLLTSVVLILPCAAGYIILAKPIYNLIYPNASLGYELLQISTICLIFTALNQTVTGALQGIGKVFVPALALTLGCVVKLVSNIILIRIPQINIYGAPIGSILCQLTVFAIELYCLSKKSSNKIDIYNIFLKPLFCCLAMSPVTYGAYTFILYLFDSNFIALFGSIALSALVYVICVIMLKIFSHDELAKIPLFGKLYIFLHKKYIQKDKSVIK